MFSQFKTIIALIRFPFRSTCLSLIYQCNFAPVCSGESYGCQDEKLTLRRICYSEPTCYTFPNAPPLSSEPPFLQNPQRSSMPCGPGLWAIRLASPCRTRSELRSVAARMGLDSCLYLYASKMMPETTETAMSLLSWLRLELDRASRQSPEGLSHSRVHDLKWKHRGERVLRME